MSRTATHAAAAGAVTAVSLLAACSGTPPGQHTAPGAAGQGRLVVATAAESWRLPHPVARLVAVPDGPGVVLAGGLTTGDVSSAGVYRLDPTTGRLRQIGQLPQPVHDAAGALIGRNVFVYGGGAQTTTAAIQRVDSAGHGSLAGRLPQARADLSAATLGGRVVLLGGYTGAAPTSAILATRTGTAVTRIGTLPVPVRYGATVSDGHHIWVFGGARGTQPVDDIQRVDASGAAHVVGHLPAPLTEATALDVDGTILLAGGRPTATTTSDTVYAFDPATATVRPVAHLPVAVADAGGVAVGATGYLVGGENATQVSTVQRLTVTHARTPGTTRSTSPHGTTAPPVFTGRLLIADRGNNRLLLVDAAKHILWRFPTRARPAPPSGFYFPDDAFFIHHGTGIISNQEGNDTIVEIGFPSGKSLWSYGHRKVASPRAGYLDQPDDAYLLADGKVVVADARNCRVVIINEQRHQIGQIGTPGSCNHHPPADLGYPNGDTPLRDGNILVSEVHGSWVSEYTLAGHLVWTVQLPAVSYPSDPQQIGPDRYLVADYAHPGGLFEFNRHGTILWRYQPRHGYRMLDHPSLAEVLPGGDIAVNDDYRNRVVIIDPRTRHIVWQYGHTDTAGTRPGYLNTPDGFDLLEPDGSTPTHPFTS